MSIMSDALGNVLTSTRGGPVVKILQKPLFIPETTSLSIQLNQFRQSSIQMALVVDEYGVLQGLITLEDILEEIVGEIFDEFDKPVASPSKLNDGSVLVDGTMTVRDINRFMDWKIPDDEASTLAGLFIEKAQKLPKEGEVLRIKDFEFKVIKRNKTRISKLSIIKTIND